MIKIYPALLGIDEEQVNRFAQLRGIADRVHVDVMDNIFVPNKTVGAELIKPWAEKEGLFVWAHLMIHDIKAFFSAYELPEGSLVSFHLEAEKDILGIIKMIKEKKYVPSIAISPKTPVEKSIPFLNDVDHILVMSVEPGFSGQPFLPEVISKIDTLAEFRNANHLAFRIAIDGGINRSNIADLAKKGVDDFAVASGIFAQPDPAGALRKLEDLVKN